MLERCPWHGRLRRRHRPLRASHTLTYLIFFLVVAGWQLHGVKTPGAGVALADEILNQQVGGNDIGDDEYLSFAAILEIDGSQFNCGGVVIGLRYVMTAKHCFKDKDYSLFRVHIGYLCEEPANCSRPNELITIRFSWDFPDGDMTLLELRNPISPLNAMSLPAAVPHLGKKFQPNQPVVRKKLEMFLVSAGREGSQAVRNDRVQKLKVRHIKTQDCEREYPNAGEEFFQDSTVCSISEGGNPCQGDSGSPLFVAGKGPLFEGRDLVMAIHTFGPRNCDDPSKFSLPSGHFRVSDAADFLVRIVCNGPHRDEQDWCPPPSSVPGDEPPVGVMPSVPTSSTRPTPSPVVSVANTAPFGSEKFTYRFGEVFTIQFSIEKAKAKVGNDVIGIYPADSGTKLKNEKAKEKVKKAALDQGSFYAGKLTFTWVLNPGSYIAVYHRDKCCPYEAILRSDPFTVANYNPDFAPVTAEMSSFRFGEIVSVALSIDKTMVSGRDRVGIFPATIGPDPTNGLNPRSMEDSKEVKKFAVENGNSMVGKTTFSAVLNPGSYRVVYYRENCQSCPLGDIARSEPFEVEAVDSSLTALTVVEAEKTSYKFGEKISVTFSIDKGLGELNGNEVGIFPGSIGPDPATGLSPSKIIVAQKVRKSSSDTGDAYVGTLLFTQVLNPGSYRVVYYRDATPLDDIVRSEPFVVDSHDVSTASIGTDKSMYAAGEDVRVTFSIDKTMAVVGSDRVGIFNDSVGPNPHTGLNSFKEKLSLGVKKAAVDDGDQFVGTLVFNKSLKPGSYRAAYYRFECTFTCPYGDIVRSDTFTVAG